MYYAHFKIYSCFHQFCYYYRCSFLFNWILKLIYNVIDICILIAYPATIVNFFYYLNSIFHVYYYYIICVNRDLLLFYPIDTLSYLTVYNNISNMVLKGNTITYIYNEGRETADIIVLFFFYLIKNTLVFLHQVSDGFFIELVTQISLGSVY